MKEYICKEDAILAITGQPPELHYPDWYRGCIAEIPPAKVVEKKTSHWVKVPGYATPGGDPVWACYRCGKGIHVYGIEASTYGKEIAEHQWIACPNCGSVMIGEEE